jgi:hypothetical protein
MVNVSFIVHLAKYYQSITVTSGFLLQVRQAILLQLCRNISASSETVSSAVLSNLHFFLVMLNVYLYC